MPPISDALQGVTITDKAISLVLEGRFIQVKRDSAQGRDLETLLTRGETTTIEEIKEAVDPQKWVAKITLGRITIDENDQMRLDGQKVDYGLTASIIDLHSRGLPLDALANFTESVAKNPDQSIAAGLYPFLMKGNHPITPQGGFLAWKAVRPDFYSYHSGNEDWTAEISGHTWSGKGGRVFHPVGGVVSLPREQCDPSQGTACSRGLHACSHDYLPGYMGGEGALLLVEIMPEDVTAFPSHYEAKLRCCRYKVVDHINKTTMAEVAAHLTGGIETQYNTPEAADEVEGAVRQGHADGLTAGRADFEAGNEYDATDYEFPTQISTGRARSAYQGAYLQGYGEGWKDGEVARHEEEAMEGDPEEEADRLTEERAADPAWFDDFESEDQARSAGERDGYRYAMGDTLYDPDWEEGEQYDRVPPRWDDSYRRGFMIGYERRFKEENGA